MMVFVSGNARFKNDLVNDSIFNLESLLPYGRYYQQIFIWSPYVDDPRQHCSKYSYVNCYIVFFSKKH